MKTLVKIIIIIIILCVNIKENCSCGNDNKKVSEEILFSMINDTLEQDLNIQFLANNNISFAISSKNLLSNRYITISGIATLDKNSEGENFTDDVTGVGVFCKVFIYVSQEYVLRILIDTNCKNQAIIDTLVDNNTLITKKECPITSLRNLRRVCQ